MRSALLRLAIMLVIAAPMLVSQTAPAPPEKPKAPAAPARPPARRINQYAVLAGGSGSYLGIDPRDVTADRVGALKLKNERGVEVAMVDQDSPAGKAGLKEHDVILSFNGQNVESVEELKRMLRETPPGRTVALGISRDGSPMTLNVQLGNRAKIAGARPFVPEINIPPMPELPDMPAIMVLQSVGRNGIMVESLTAQLGDYFGAKNGEGVLVRSVEKATPGEAAGLKAGDVIVGIGSERVGDASDWRRLIRGHQGETVQLRVLRDKREMTLPLAIPKRRETGALEWGDWDFDYSGVEDELQRLKPELEKIKAVQVAQFQREMQLHRQDWERANQQVRTELERAMRSQHADMEKAQRELEKAQQQLQKELQKELQDRQERY